MITKLKKLLTIGFAFGLISAPLIAVPAVAYADTIGSGLSCGAELNPGSVTSGTSNCPSGTTDPGSTLNNIVTLVINIFSVVVGIVAVIMIIVGGLKYITSGGDSGNITGAKNTILYAIIGLVVVALAQFIVRFVLQKVGNTATGG